MLQLSGVPSGLADGEAGLFVGFPVCKGCFVNVAKSGLALLGGFCLLTERATVWAVVDLGG